MSPTRTQQLDAAREGRSRVKSFFTPKEIRELVKVSYRQIQYWDKSNFISPSYRRRGKYRLYTFSDLIQLKVAEILRASGCSIQQLRSTIENLRKMLAKITFPYSELNILFRKDRILLFQGDVKITGKSEDYIYFSARALRQQLDAHSAQQERDVATEKRAA